MLEWLTTVGYSTTTFPQENATPMYTHHGLSNETFRTLPVDPSVRRFKSNGAYVRGFNSQSFIALLGHDFGTRMHPNNVTDAHFTLSRHISDQTANSYLNIDITDVLNFESRFDWKAYRPNRNGFSLGLFDGSFGVDESNNSTGRWVL